MVVVALLLPLQLHHQLQLPVRDRFQTWGMSGRNCSNKVQARSRKHFSSRAGGQELTHSQNRVCLLLLVLLLLLLIFMTQ